MEVAEQIRAHRERAGLSQEALAREIFVSRQTVSNWETGKTYPDVQSLLLLSNLFNASIDDLVKGDLATMEKNTEQARATIKIASGIAWALIAFGILSAALLIHEGVEIRFPVYFLVFIPFAAAQAASYVSDRVKAEYDLETMAELEAFFRGADPAEIDRSRRMDKRLSIALKLVLGGMAGALFASLFATLVGLIAL